MLSEQSLRSIVTSAGAQPDDNAYLLSFKKRLLSVGGAMKR
jgi:hypothetical protein